MYFISAAVILLASLALTVQVPLPYNKTGKASVLYSFILFFFRVFCGLKTLFNTYLDEIITKWQNQDITGIKLSKNQRLSTLLFAADQVTIADTEDSLHKAAHKLNKITRIWFNYICTENKIDVGIWGIIFKILDRRLVIPTWRKKNLCFCTSHLFFKIKAANCSQMLILM